jgi:RNA-directed DNA polymerase
VRTPQLRNYRYRWRARRGGPPRVIEQPKRLLKECQRRMLHQILDAVPPHDAAHGFRPGHSAVTHARRHTGREVVLRVDLEDFFASVTAGRVYGIFRRAGYPEAVAHALTGLCTNVVPQEEWSQVPRPHDPAALAAHHRLGRRLATPHLPQGAPTSPALANLCGYRLDCRLAALADRVGGVYSRYADDDVRSTIAEIVRDEGFRVNERKSQLMVRAGRQRVCGIVVNERPNLGRRERDRLRAAMHDARLHGPEAANRAGVPDLQAHLEGRVSWAEALNPRHGAALRTQLARVNWATESP